VLVLKLTELHGGSVRVESEVGEGSRFTVILPNIVHEIIDQHDEKRLKEQIESTEAPEPNSDQSGIILLAEDNETNILTVSDYLIDKGFQVSIARNGFEAVAMAEQLPPSLILMDIQMPKMDGLEAIRHLRANPEYASVPIIAITALAMPGDRERCLEAGANEYMSKPISLKKLIKTIKNLSGEMS
jgi:CheY-like chemotaxis protein